MRSLVFASAFAVLGCAAEIDVEETRDEPAPRCDKDDRLVGDGGWIRPFGDGRYFGAPGDRIAVDARGDIIAILEAGADFSLDCADLGASGVDDRSTALAVTKLGADGQVRWVHRLGPERGRTHGVLAGVDAEGSAYVVAVWRTEDDAGFFVTRLSPEGEPMWTADYPQGNPQLALDAGDADVSPEGSTALALDYRSDLVIDGELFDAGVTSPYSKYVLLSFDSGGGLVSKKQRNVFHLEVGAGGRAATRWYEQTEVTKDGELVWTADDSEGSIHIARDQLLDGPYPGPWLRGRDVETGETLWESPSWSYEDIFEDCPGGLPVPLTITETPTGWAAGSLLCGRADPGTGWLESDRWRALLTTLGPEGDVRGVRLLQSEGESNIDDLAALPDGRLVVFLVSDGAIDVGYGPIGGSCEKHCLKGYLAVIPAPTSHP